MKGYERDIAFCVRYYCTEVTIKHEQAFGYYYLATKHTEEKGLSIKRYLHSGIANINKPIEDIMQCIVLFTTKRLINLKKVK